MEYKTMPVYPQDIADRTITGFAAVMGNVDEGKDRIRSGAFTKTLLERKSRVSHLWQHDFESPPIATITDLQEVKRAALPSEVLADYPDATGGLQVSRKYLETPRAEEVYQGVVSGAIKGMSFGFEPVKREYTKSGDVTIRELHEVKLIETSDTPFPMNPAARARKSYMLYSLLEQLDTIDDMTTIMAMGQALTPDQLVMCQQTIALCLSLLNSAVQVDQLENVLGSMTPPMVALRKAVAGATWLKSPGDLVWDAAVQARGLKTADPELFKQNGFAADLIGRLQTKQGRVISAANQAKIRTVMDALMTQLETLDNLLSTAEPSADDNSAKSLTDTAVLLALLDLQAAELS